MRRVTLLEIIAVADRIGIVAFAVSGVAVGVRRQLDLYGLLALGMTTAIGGGAVRDILLGDVPRAFANVDYLLFAAGASVAAIIAAAWGWRWPDRLLAAADAAGTGAFAVTGALLARESGLALPAAIVLAILTATGGGVLRDLLANRVPMVLRTELNATGAAFGGIVAFALAGESEPAAAAVGAVIAAAISLAGHARRGRLPRIGRTRSRQGRLL
jgi:uncharacterized membrane protein YeiH